MCLFRFLPTLGLAATLAAPARAQTPVAPADTARPAPRPYGHELGLTVSPQFANLFTSHRVLPLGLLYRRQLRPGRAWRLRLTGTYSRRDTATAGGAFYIQERGPTARAWEVSAFAGYEWQRRLGRRWQLHYGAEAGPGYRREHRDYTNRDYDPVGVNGAGPYTITEVGSRDLARWRVQGRGFAGLSYDLSGRVRLLAETALGVSYQRQTSWGSYTSSIDNSNYDISPGGIYRDYTVTTWRLTYFPVQVLGLTVGF